MHVDETLDFNCPDQKRHLISLFVPLVRNSHITPLWCMRAGKSQVTRGFLTSNNGPVPIPISSISCFLPLWRRKRVDHSLITLYVLQAAPGYTLCPSGCTWVDFVSFRLNLGTLRVLQVTSSQCFGKQVMNTKLNIRLKVLNWPRLDWIF